MTHTRTPTCGENDVHLERRVAERRAPQPTAAVAQAVPAGWKRVPVEPTPEMVSAPNTIIQAYGAKLIYERMLAAAPDAPAAEVAGGLSGRVRALAEKWNKQAIADGFGGSEPAYELFEVLDAPAAPDVQPVASNFQPAPKPIGKIEVIYDGATFAKMGAFDVSHLPNGEYEVFVGISPAGLQPTATIEQIFESWDGCNYDGIDIGAALRADFKNFVFAAAVPVAERQVQGCAIVPRIFTYANQPGNVEAWRFGEAASNTAKKPGGDYIDTGLQLLLELQNKGYGIVAVEGLAQSVTPPASQAATTGEQE